MKKLAIGIDIGGINTAFGVVDEEGTLFAESLLSTRQYPFLEDYPRYAADLGRALHSLVEGLPFDCEVINLWKFRAEEPDRDAQRRIFPLAADLSALFGGIEIRMTNDANAAAIGEMVFGNARGMRDFIMVTLGTGLGSGFVANGELICGHDGFAGELGHVIVEPEGRMCGCGRRGCLETYVSATGIRRTAFELLAERTEPSVLRSIAFDDLDAAMLTQAAEAGDPLAREAFRRTGQRLGYALADAVTITSPEAIFLFGGLAKAGRWIFEPTQRYMEERMMYPYRGKVKLLPSGLTGRNAAIPGAAALIWRNRRPNL